MPFHRADGTVVESEGLGDKTTSQAEVATKPLILTRVEVVEGAKGPPGDPGAPGIGSEPNGFVLGGLLQGAPNTLSAVLKYHLAMQDATIGGILADCGRTDFPLQHADGYWVSCDFGSIMRFTERLGTPSFTDRLRVPISRNYGAPFGCMKDMLLDPVTKRLFLLDGGVNNDFKPIGGKHPARVRVVDTTTTYDDLGARLIATIDIPIPTPTDSNNYLSDLAYDGEFLWVVARDSRIYKVDVNKGTVTPYDLGFGEFSSIGYCQGRLYVGDNNSNNWFVFDLSGQLLETHLEAAAAVVMGVDTVHGKIFIQSSRVTVVGGDTVTLACLIVVDAATDTNVEHFWPSPWNVPSTYLMGFYMAPDGSYFYAGMTRTGLVNPYIRFQKWAPSPDWATGITKQGVDLYPFDTAYDVSTFGNNVMASNFSGASEEVRVTNVDTNAVAGAAAVPVGDSAQLADDHSIGGVVVWTSTSK